MNSKFKIQNSKLKTLFLGIILFSSTSLFSAPLRIVSLAPATTEILFALGLENEIVGVSTLCNYPPSALKKPKIGTFSEPNIEVIMNLKPDLIFATDLEQDFIVQKLRKLGFKVHQSSPANFRELIQSISAIGALTHRDKEAQRLTAQMKKRIQKVQASVAKVPVAQRPTVFFELWYEPLMTAAEGSFVDELITLAGGKNIAGKLPRPYCYYSPEQVILKNPDWIVIGNMQKEESVTFLEKRFHWQAVNAVRKHQIVTSINPDLLLRPTPRLVEGLEALAAKIGMK
jgi:iron complex transport system substrate-binding protein